MFCRTGCHCLPLAFLPPIPPAPFPQRGRGRFIVILCKGLRPLHPRGLNPRGTGVGASLVRSGRLAPASSARRALSFALVPYPPDPLPRRGRGRFIVILCKGLRPLHPRGLNPGGTGSSCGGDCLRCCLLWNRHKRRPNNRFIREKFWGVWGTLSRVPQRFPRFP